mgnify:CR=1 FL=1
MNELEWNVDGHRMLLWVEKSILKVTAEICPLVEFGGFKTNVQNYGLETNSGIIPAEHSVECAWAMSGSPWDIDLVQFSIIPVNDPAFKDWYSSVTAESK